MGEAPRTAEWLDNQEPKNIKNHTSKLILPKASADSKGGVRGDGEGWRGRREEVEERKQKKEK